MRWFRLAGIPSAERLAALRLQVGAWLPFPSTEGRLVLSGEEGLAIVWDETVVRQLLLDAGLEPERCLLIAEPLTHAASPDGLRLLQGADGFEAQRWHEGFLRASRWWAEPLQARDWQEFVHASGAGRDAGVTSIPLPQPQSPHLATAPWAKHYPLHANANDTAGPEHRVVLAGALVLTLVVGALAHRLWDVQQQGSELNRQIAEVKTAAATVLSARDATIAAVNDVEKLATWFAVPQPIDVIGYLNEALGRSGVQIKDFELEGDKLRLGLQLAPQAARVGVVKDLQAGGWFADVTEVRSDNARGLLTMEMRVVASRPGTAAPAAVVQEPAAPAAAVQAGGIPAGAAAALGGTGPAPAVSRAVPARAAAAGSAVVIPGPPLSTIMKDGKLDPSYVPPPEVFR